MCKFSSANFQPNVHPWGQRYCLETQRFTVLIFYLLLLKLCALVLEPCLWPSPWPFLAADMTLSSGKSLFSNRISYEFLPFCMKIKFIGLVVVYLSTKIKLRWGNTIAPRTAKLVLAFLSAIVSKERNWEHGWTFPIAASVNLLMA